MCSRIPYKINKTNKKYYYFKKVQSVLALSLPTKQSNSMKIFYINFTVVNLKDHYAPLYKN